MPLLSKKRRPKEKNNPLENFVRLGRLLILAGFIILIFTYWPVILVEFKYQTNKKNKFDPQLQQDVLATLDSAFSLYIPKINAQAKVMVDVDPYNSLEYQRKLAFGVAHARGSALPDQPGNVFIFSHSAINFYEAIRFNAVFYLLQKLEKNDDLFLKYQNQVYHYQVRDKRLVKPAEVEYLSRQENRQLITLMTCWPPGTNKQRLLVIGELKP